MRRKRKRYVLKERRKDEESLYYILERDLDREAIFREHDGWYSQVPSAKGKVDYVIKYEDRVYGIEVKVKFPKFRDFRQTERYRDALNGIFLAYPSDWVGEALYLSEVKHSYTDVGLISLSLFRSHVIRKAKRFERRSDQLWKDQRLDEAEYWRHISTWGWYKDCSLPATVLKNGCFWTSFSQSGKESEENLYKYSFNPSDWRGLGLLYMATFAVSLDRYFSKDYLFEMGKQSLGWESFNLWKWVQGGLVDYYSYSDRLQMFSLTDEACFLKSMIEEALQENLGLSEWGKINEKIKVWKEKHESNREIYEKDFINISRS